MKSSNLKIAQLAIVISLLGAGCNSGSSTKLVVVTNSGSGSGSGSNSDPNPTPTVTYTPISGPHSGDPRICPAWGCGVPVGIYPVRVTSAADSTDSDSRDTDLQQADLQNASLNSRAQALSNQFQMSVEAATQLAVLGDKVQLMTSQGQELSDEDRDAITQSALGIAGISSDEVNEALQHAVAGDNTATDALVEKAAKNLGMPNSENLRGQLLQALGVQLQ